MKALLVRVGVDHSFGGWNAPVDAENRFVYVPIPESEKTVFHGGLERNYAEVLPALERFSVDRCCNLTADLKLPSSLVPGLHMHLDPDFDHLTYGDDGGRRGAGMVGMNADDLLVFYSSMRPIHMCEHKLLYAIIGLFVIQEVVAVQSVPSRRWAENAHTRKATRGEKDIVVRAKPGVSGRLERCLPIGELRDGAYRVRNEVLAEWGGLSVKDGYIQRSAVPPSFTDPNRFHDWFKRQEVSLLKGNGW